MVEIEQVVAAAERASSVQACADALRPVTVSLPSAMRWVRRRMAPVHALLPIVVAMVPQHLQGCAATIQVFHERLVAAPAAGSATASAGGSAPGSALMRLRDVLGVHLAALVCPIGFRHRSPGAGEHRTGRQQPKGPDPPRQAS